MSSNVTCDIIALCCESGFREEITEFIGKYSKEAGTTCNRIASIMFRQTNAMRYYM